MLQKIVAITFLTLTLVLNLLHQAIWNACITWVPSFSSDCSGASTSLMFDKTLQKVIIFGFGFITLETGQ